MQTIIFETFVKDGNVCIPNQYSLNNKKVKVIILSDLDFPNKKSIESQQKPLTSIIQKAQGKGCFKSVSEINDFIRNERNQWD